MKGAAFRKPNSAHLFIELRSWSQYQANLRTVSGTFERALPSKLDLAVNLSTAKALCITIPQSVLLRAERVIE